MSDNLKIYLKSSHGLINTSPNSKIVNGGVLNDPFLVNNEKSSQCNSLQQGMRSLGCLKSYLKCYTLKIYLEKRDIPDPGSAHQKLLKWIWLHQIPMDSSDHPVLLISCRFGPMQGGRTVKEIAKT